MRAVEERDEQDICAECGTAEVAAYYSDGAGGLVPFCAECAAKESLWQPPESESRNA